MAFRPSCLVLAGIAAACGAAAAQQAPPAGDAAAVSAAALQGYRPFSEVDPLPWRQANDAVGRIGGWRAYAREAQAGSSAPAAPASAPAAPRAAEPHGNHPPRR